MGWWILFGLILLAGRSKDESEDETSDDDAPPPEDNEANEGSRPRWVLPGIKREGKPTPRGRFGVRRTEEDGTRKHHAGVDLAAPRFTSIIAPESGTVSSHQGWDGPDARALMFQTDRGPAFLFGAVDGPSRAKVGTRLEPGDEIAKVGRYPLGGTMLHLEAYRKGQKFNVKWPWDEERPEVLLDPSIYVMLMEEEHA